MKFAGDYHLHTFASDGRASVENHIAAAKRMGLEEIAIADHSFSTLLCHVTEKKFAAQNRTVSELSMRQGIKVLQGIEGNIAGSRLDVPQSVIRRCDVLIAGFHRFVSQKFAGEDRGWIMSNGFGSRAAREKLIVKNTEAYIAVMERYPIDIIAHLGHRAYVDFGAVCECAAKHDVYIELNAKHLDTLEGGITAALESGVNFIVGSDAHSAGRTGELQSIAEFIKRHGLPLDRIYGTEGRLPSFKDKRKWTYGNDV